MRPRTDGLFIKLEHPSLEMRVKMSTGVRRHWQIRPHKPRVEVAAEQARADRNRELVRRQLAELRKQGIK
jgi:hypothetical protein